MMHNNLPLIFDRTANRRRPRELAFVRVLSLHMGEDLNKHRINQWWMGNKRGGGKERRERCMLVGY